MLSTSNTRSGPAAVFVNKRSLFTLSENTGRTQHNHRISQFLPPIIGFTTEISTTMASSPHVLTASNSEVTLPKYTRRASNPLPTYSNESLNVELQRLERAQIAQKSDNARRTYDEDLEAQSTDIRPTPHTNGIEVRDEAQRQRQQIRAPQWKPLMSFKTARVGAVVLFSFQPVLFIITWHVCDIARRDRDWYDSLPTYWQEWIAIAKVTRWYALGGWIVSAVTVIELYFEGKDLLVQRRKNGRFSRKVSFVQQLVPWHYLVLLFVLTWQFFHF